MSARTHSCYTHGLLVAAVATALAGRVNAADVAYSASMASGLDCGSWTTGMIPTDVGSAGAVGYVKKCGSNAEEWAFRWSGVGPIELLPIPPDAYSTLAEATDELGRVGLNVEYASDALDWVAYLLDGPTLTQLPMPRGSDATYVIGLNGTRAVGYWANTITGPYRRPALWDLARGDMLDIPITYGPFGTAVDVNASGHVCGWMGYAEQSDSHGFLYADGVLTDLGAITGGISGQPSAINASGTIVGSGRLIDPKTGASRRSGFIWSNGEMTVVHPYPEYPYCHLRDINDQGDIIGVCWNGSSEVCFILRGGQATDLDELIPADPPLTIDYPSAIDNDGRIAGIAVDLERYTSVGVLLTPVPASADLDGDGAVGGADLAIMLGAWGACGVCRSDLDTDGIVDGQDLALLLGAWER
jgi:probable HAF family extracellular repeat protein